MYERSCDTCVCVCVFWQGCVLCDLTCKCEHTCIFICIVEFSSIWGCCFVPVRLLVHCCARGKGNNRWTLFYFFVCVWGCTELRQCRALRICSTASHLTPAARWSPTHLWGLRFASPSQHTVTAGTYRHDPGVSLVGLKVRMLRFSYSHLCCSSHTSVSLFPLLPVFLSDVASSDFEQYKASQRETSVSECNLEPHLGWLSRVLPWNQRWKFEIPNWVHSAGAGLSLPMRESNS